MTITFILNTDGLKHWVINYKINGWIVNPLPIEASLLLSDTDFDGHSRCFVTYDLICDKKQKIIFKDYGLNNNLMKTLQPEILVSEW